MKENVLVAKSMDFAVRIVNLHRYLNAQKREYVLSKQLLRSATSIGANVREGIYGQSREDFTAKMSSALKEASETEYWLELLMKTEYLTQEQYMSVRTDCAELAKMLTAVVKSSKVK